MSSSSRASLPPDQPVSPMVYKRRIVETSEIPYIHPKIDVRKLYNGKILPDERIREINAIVGSKDGVYQVDNRVYIRNKGALYAMPVESKLGAGAFGEVHLMQNLETGDWVVVKKQIAKKKKDDDIRYTYSVHLISKENKALKDTKLHEFDYGAYGDETFYTGMKLISGSNLHDVINETRTFPPVRWVDMAISMVESLENIHNAGLLHCDIKPHNMNFDPATHTVTHIDLGLSSIANNKKEAKERSRKGSPRYMAPELRNGKAPFTYNEKTEVYALGMSMAEMFGFSNFEQNIRIPDPKMLESVEKFLQSMLEVDPSKRPTLAEAKKFFQALREDFLNAPALLNRIIALDLTGYQKATPEQKQKMISSLKDAHEVWLVDHDKKNEAQYIAIRQELEKEGIIVNRQVIQKPEEGTVVSIVKDYARVREARDKNIYICGIINNEGVVAYPDTVSSRHLEKIIKSLEADLDRLNRKYPNSHSTRKNAVQDAIKQLRAASVSLKYTDLERTLNDLQNHLHSKSSLRRFTARLTDSTFHVSRQKIKSLKQEVKQISQETHLRATRRR